MNRTNATNLTISAIALSAYVLGIAYLLGTSIQRRQADSPTSQPTSRPAAGPIAPHLQGTDIAGSWAVGREPQPGDLAPDFSLRPIKFYDWAESDSSAQTSDNNQGQPDELYRTVTLSDFRGHKPVALVFGSYT